MGVWTNIPRKGYRHIAIGAYSLGFFIAKGEFIGCQDSDDLSNPNRMTGRGTVTIQIKDIHKTYVSKLNVYISTFTTFAT